MAMKRVLIRTMSELFAYHLLVAAFTAANYQYFF